MTEMGTASKGVRTWLLMAMAWGALLVLPACGEDGGKSGQCTPGNLGCTCLEGENPCFDPGCGCVDGVCLYGQGGADVVTGDTSQGCTAGLEGCACYGNDTCDVGLTCTDAGLCVPSGCKVGTDACPCYDNDTCNSGFACNGDKVCEPAPCVAGTKTCPCYGNGSCNEGLSCTDEQVCIDDGCVSGTLDCPCYGNGSCNQELVCNADDLCEEDTCEPGSKGCACYPNATCDEGLKCNVDALCVDLSEQPQECPEGTLGCSCTDKGACLVQGLECASDATCQSPLCPRGLPGCGCKQDGTCYSSYSCQVGICVFDPTVGPKPPESPKCYTPCKSSVTLEDGSYVICPADGLMPGCLDGYNCVQGTCVCVADICKPEVVEEKFMGYPVLVPKNGDVPVQTGPASCLTDLECPDWQTCVGGECYSVCEVDKECADGTKCYRHVCRQPCNAKEPDCPAGMFCEKEKGNDGYCMLLPDSETEGDESVPGLFSVDENVHIMSPFAPGSMFVLSNDGDVAMHFEVRKASHTKFTDVGPVEVESNALFWLQMGVDGAESDEASFELDLEAGETAEILLSDADQSELVRYDGVLEVEGFVPNDEEGPGKSSGLRRVFLHFRGSPRGQWTGSMFYFGSFPDAGITEWLEHKNESYYIDKLDNALLRRWSTFRRAEGDLSWTEFQAVLTATINQSWQFGSVKAQCPPGQAQPDPNTACYLFADPWGISEEGVVLYSSNLDEVHIPTAATELPVAINLAPANAQTLTSWEGRIDSGGTLHYAGNPALTLAFEASPAQCQTVNGNYGDCLTFVEDLASDILVGGRMYAEGDSCPSGYKERTVPWLPKDFSPPQSADGPYCLATTLPYGSDSEFEDVNGGYAAANPLPNGMALERKLRLLDGALINQEILFVLFQEQFDLVINTGEEGTENCSSYGFMVLHLTDPNIAEEDYDGLEQESSGSTSPVVPKVNFSQEFLNDVADQTEDGPTANFIKNFRDYEPSDQGCALAGNPATCKAAVERMARAGLTGQLEENDYSAEIAGSGWYVHYLCDETGMIDQGPVDQNGESPCPPGSDVTYFAAWGQPPQVAGSGDPGDHFEYLACNLQSELKFSYTDKLLCNDLDTGGTYSFDWDEDENEDAQDDDPYDCDTEDQTVQTWFNVLNKDENGSPLPAGECQSWLDARHKAWECAATNGDGCANYTKNGTACTTNSDCDTGFHCEADEGGDKACRYNYRFDLFWACEGKSGQVGAYCDDPWNLVADKEFFWSYTPDEPVSDLPNEIDDAFRYKVKFINRQGTSLGFAPQMCQGGADAGSYCYDPDAIEHSRMRVDGLLRIYTYFGTDLYSQDADLFADVKDFLLNDFSYHVDENTGIMYNGFERLASELQVMMGDEAYTQAFAARFDVAGMQAATFPGEELEPPDGINLSGGAGYEMRNLYLATQYYDLALNRFFEMAPTIWDSFEMLDISDYYITQASVAHYLDRLVRASAQKARAWSEIAKRYQGFDRPDLARKIVERAYTGTYLESVVFHQFLKKIMKMYENTADYDQIARIAEEAALRYRQGLLEMRDVYSAISTDTTFFGFPPDYIPFPALESNIDFMSYNNAFDQMMERALSRMEVAADKEELAIASSIDFNVDVAAFESELASIRASYEEELMDICGSFEGDDGTIYPAIPRFASQHAKTQVLMQTKGTPCGWVGNGEIHEAMQEIAKADLDVWDKEMALESLLLEVEYERDRVNKACDVMLELQDYKWDAADEIMNAQKSITRSEQAVEDLRREVDLLGTASDIAASGDIWKAGLSAGLATAFSVGAVITEISCFAIQDNIVKKEQEIAKIEQAVAYWETESECLLAQIDSDATVKTIMLDLGALQVDAMKTGYDLRLAYAEVQQLQNKARSLQDKMAEAEQNAINVMAAMNDPNIRIYKNDAIIAADRTFERALKEAYRATRVLEYYTSQSYAHLGDLFLVRSVAHGEYTLENYLAELEDAYYEFEDSYGNPDIRVKIYSLRDDIMDIPYQVSDYSCGSETVKSNICSEENRIDKLREALQNPELVDANGYIVIPFSTSISELSPLTYNHKIHYIEVEIQGTDLGDEVARVYLRQIGTGTIRSLEAKNFYYAFPQRTAVVDAWLNEKDFENIIYDNMRLKDRPLANSKWQLIVNLVDEPDNADLDLFNGLRDMRIHMFYTDFTEL